MSTASSNAPAYRTAMADLHTAAWLAIAMLERTHHATDAQRLEAAEALRRELAAQPAQEAVAGYVLVPDKPTLDMAIAWADVFYTKRRAIDDDDISDWWYALLAAAPKPTPAPDLCPASGLWCAGACAATAPAAGDELPPLPEPWIRDMTCAQPESHDHFAADQMHEYARAAIAADRAARSQNQPAEEWYCETHPEHLMGHDGCGGAGILESCRVHMLSNQLRLARQEVREAETYRDDVIMGLRAALQATQAPAVMDGPTDTQRLDWLIQQARLSKNDWSGWWEITLTAWQELKRGSFKHAIIRAAIDAEMGASQPPVQGSQP